jgi:superoxide dismutase, Cu-Zn family
MSVRASLTLVTAALLCVAGCGIFSGRSVGKVAEAKVAALGGSNVTGAVTFTQKRDAVEVYVKLSGLGGTHGFHVHEKGDCSATDGASAGAHFALEKVEHGARTGAPRHAGDMGNLVTTTDTVEERFEVMGISVGDGKPTDIANRAVIVHAGADDLKTQPAGNSGKRIACGVIVLK